MKLTRALLSHSGIFLHLAAAAAVTLAVAASMADAAGKKPPSSPETTPSVFKGKRVIELRAIAGARVELPDGRLYDFGEGFEAKLTTRLQGSGRYVITQPAPMISGRSVFRSAQATNEPIYSWTGSSLPSGVLKIRTDALFFQAGDRGSRMVYGFDRGYRSPFNDGSGEVGNEFPVREVLFEPNWFDRSFDERGSKTIGSAAGLDLTDGVNFNFILAWINLKMARYHAGVELDLEVTSPVTGLTLHKTVRTEGGGFFFDVSGGVEQYSFGFRLARANAMNQAVMRALEGAADAIDRALSPLPYAAKVDAVLPNGDILLGTGVSAEIQRGVRYQLAKDTSIILEIKSSMRDGAVAKRVSGNANTPLNIGDVVVEEGTLTSVGTPPGVALAGGAAGPATSDRAALGGRTLAGATKASNSLVRQTQELASENIALADAKLDKPDFQGKFKETSWWSAFAKSLVEMVLLPYRLWRYYHYDQDYKSQAVAAVKETTDENHPDAFDENSRSDATGAQDGAQSWAEEARRSEWGKSIGLDRAWPRKQGALIAVIDTGIDYNHPVIHDQIWTNAAPTFADPDLHGWDFISGDSRPFDDNYHGTEVASAILAVDPSATLMPLKVFNPWGVTTSGALYSAFVYAVDHGAQIIVCGWATRQSSKAIDMGVQYALSKGVTVVVAAGDRGEDLSHVAAYPASHGDPAGTVGKVITVASLGANGQLSTQTGLMSNYDPHHVAIAAPGEGLKVADPRGHSSTRSGSGLAAGLVAGALSLSGTSEGSSISVADPTLAGKVSGGRRLWLGGASLSGNF